MSEQPEKKTEESALHVRPGVSVDPNHVRRPKMKRRAISIEEHVEGVLKGNRSIIGRTLTLMESANQAHRAKAAEVLQQLLPYSGASIRLGISGVPGVGKSTFIESLGTMLTAEGHRVAVLTVDPSSELSGGSILGDKTRMEKLATDPNAIVRPSASGKTLGGVARGTREMMIICEAAGYDIIIVETVGVGQSETQVASMVDFFLLLMLAGAGDELQGIKRGIIEMADAIAINKADGVNVGPARSAKNQYQNALKLLRPATEGWTPLVLTCSAMTSQGMGDIWKVVLEHNEMLRETGRLEEKRDRQALYWLKQTIEQQLVENFYRHPKVADRIERYRRDVLEGRISPFNAAEELLSLTGDREGAPATESPEKEGNEAE